eukprot:15346828-Ditylum_brightwellii.AAC.1
MGSVEELALLNNGETGLFVCIVELHVAKMDAKKEEENQKEAALLKKVTKLSMDVEGSFAS